MLLLSLDLSLLYTAEKRGDHMQNSQLSGRKYRPWKRCPLPGRHKRQNISTVWLVSIVWGCGSMSIQITTVPRKPAVSNCYRKTCSVKLLQKDLQCQTVRERPAVSNCYRKTCSVKLLQKDLQCQTVRERPAVSNCYRKTCSVKLLQKGCAAAWSRDWGPWLHGDGLLLCLITCKSFWVQAKWHVLLYDIIWYTIGLKYGVEWKPVAMQETGKMWARKHQWAVKSLCSYIAQLFVSRRNYCWYELMIWWTVLVSFCCV